MLSCRFWNAEDRSGNGLEGMRPFRLKCNADASSGNVANVNCDEVNTASVGNQLLQFLAVPLREIWTVAVSLSGTIELVAPIYLSALALSLGKGRSVPVRKSSGLRRLCVYLAQQSDSENSYEFIEFCVTASEIFRSTLSLKYKKRFDESCVNTKY